MDAPIGVIDSGVGGLTVVKEMLKVLPKEKIIYIGDTARCPYGPRPAAEVIKFTFDMAEALKKQHIKLLVVACNTATAVALDLLQEKMPFPVIGVIFPGARAAIKATKTHDIAVLGTVGTIKSGAYEKAILALSSSASIVPLACPKFVPVVESGEYEGPIAKKVVEETLLPLKEKKFDTIILGCTHYPLLSGFIKETVGSEVEVLSSGEETVKDIQDLLDYHGMRSTEKRSVKPVFYTSGSASLFKKIVSRWLSLEDADVRTISFT
ncbi:glutamate racemase [Chungangia koreensis]|uniref:Glutamate racemase n=1 Tax=Chungangia koreensis TaxID=752657 RepID=A0ABV8X1T5_9LACT